MSDIYIMRIGHRPERDKRVTTHVALSSRALGAKGIYVDTEDPVLEGNIQSVVERFGGDYTIKTGITWQEAVKLSTESLIADGSVTPDFYQQIVACIENI